MVPRLSQCPSSSILARGLSRSHSTFCAERGRARRTRPRRCRSRSGRPSGCRPLRAEPASARVSRLEPREPFLAEAARTAVFARAGALLLRRASARARPRARTSADHGRPLRHHFIPHTPHPRLTSKRGDHAGEVSSRCPRVNSRCIFPSRSVSARWRAPPRVDEKIEIATVGRPRRVLVAALRRDGLARPSRRRRRTTIWKPPPARVAYAILSPFGDHAGDVL